MVSRLERIDLWRRHSPRCSTRPAGCPAVQSPEVLVRAREALIATGCSEAFAVEVRASKHDDNGRIAAILAFHRDLSRPLAEVAPHTVEDADERAAKAISAERGWVVNGVVIQAIREGIKRGRELERAGKGAR